jgi:diacylglycerol kinase
MKIKTVLNSFKHAFRGIALAFQERNFKIHLIMFVLVVIAGIYFSIEDYEWIAILVISALVLSLEVMNSALERLCDLYSTEQDNRIKRIKDLAAGAVLLVAVFAIVIGLMIFLPDLLSKYP